MLSLRACWSTIPSCAWSIPAVSQPSKFRVKVMILSISRLEGVYLVLPLLTIWVCVTEMLQLACAEFPFNLCFFYVEWHHLLIEVCPWCTNAPAHNHLRWWHWERPRVFNIPTELWLQGALKGTIWSQMSGADVVLHTNCVISNCRGTWIDGVAYLSSWCPCDGTRDLPPLWIIPLNYDTVA